MKTSEKIYIKKLIKKNQIKNNTSRSYPLAGDMFGTDDLMSGLKVLLSGRLTMSHITKKFEKEFAKFVGSKYALMVNSGSSANLLAFFCLINPKSKSKLKPGDECLIPSICWSTSLWPIVQSGLKPRFVDVDVNNLNMSLKDLKKKISKKTKAILVVHILGNSVNMTELQKISKKYNLQIIEDTCESLGSKFKNKSLGTFGRFGTFSFYVSHQITSGEGGMIICNDKKDYEILHSLRAHGWDRGLNKKNNKNFNFINSGFNLRPMDLTASIGLSQLRKLNRFKKNRSFNRNIILKKLVQSKKWKNQFQFIEPIKYLNPSWFGLPILLNGRYTKIKNRFLKYLNNNKIETRPIISGNFLNQPSIKLYNLNKKKEKFKFAQDIDKRGFFIGLPTEKIESDKLNHLTDKLLKIDKLL